MIFGTFCILTQHWATIVQHTYKQFLKLTVMGSMICITTSLVLQQSTQSELPKVSVKTVLKLIVLGSVMQSAS